MAELDFASIVAGVAPAVLGLWETVTPVLERRRRADGSYEYRPKRRNAGLEAVDAPRIEPDKGMAALRVGGLAGPSLGDLGRAGQNFLSGAKGTAALALAAPDLTVGNLVRSIDSLATGPGRQEDPNLPRSMAAMAQARRGLPVQLPASLTPRPVEPDPLAPAELAAGTVASVGEEYERLKADAQARPGNYLPYLDAPLSFALPQVTGMAADPALMFGGGRIAALAKRAVPEALETAGQRTLRKAMGGMAAEEIAAPAASGRAVPAGIEDLARASLDIGTSAPVAERVPARIVRGATEGPNRTLQALDEAGAPVGSIAYTVEPEGGLSLHLIETGARGSGEGRRLLAAAAEDAGGPVRRATSLTPEGEGFLRRVGETDPALVSPETFRPIERLTEPPASPFTAIKNAVTKEERAARGMSEVEILARRTDNEAFERGKALVDGDADFPRRLARQVAERPKTLSAEESNALLVDRMKLSQDYKAADEALEAARASGDASAVTDAELRRAGLERAIDLNDQAAQRAGYEWGAAGRARQLLIREDYSAARLVQRARVATGGEPAEAVRGKLTGLARKVEEASDAIAAHEAKTSERAAQRAIGRIKKEVAFEGRRARRAATREELANEFGTLAGDFARISRAARPRAIIDPDMLAIVGKMARNRVQAGVVNVEELVDHIYQVIAPHVADLTTRDVRDAISGYGKVAAPSRDALAVQLREIRAQGRLVSALEDAEAGIVPARSGFQRGVESQKVQELRGKVREVMRVHGIARVISPEERTQSALRAAKSRLRNQIDELNKRLGGAPAKARKPIAYDAEALGLRAERDRLTEALTAMEGAGLDDARRLKIAEAATERSVKDLEGRLARGDIAPRSRLSSKWTPRIGDLRKRQADLRAQLDDLRKAALPPSSPEADRLRALKARLAKQEEDLTRRIATGDFSKKARPPAIVLDPDAMRLKARVIELRREADAEIKKLELAKRGPLDKALDFTAEWGRAVKLSGTATISKIGAAAAERSLIFAPIEEVIGGVLSKVPGVRQIAAKAPIESGFSGKAIAKSYAEFFSKQTGRDMWGHLSRMSEGELDLLYGKDSFGVQHWFDWFGHAHAAIKTPPKRAAFKLAMEKQAKYYLERGEGETLKDPARQAEMATRAYEYAQRQIFMGDNAFVSWWTRSTRAVAGDSAPTRMTKAAGRVLLPIVKVPTNYALEATDYALGLPKAVLRIGVAMKNGIASLPEREAELIMRQLKKGTFGAGLIALGAAGYEQVEGGGYYVKGERRREGDMHAGDVRLFGVTIPHQLAHHPAVEMIQIGATMRRIQESSRGRDNPAEGVRAAAKGLAEQVPFFEEPDAMGRATESTTGMRKYAGQVARGLTLPPDLQRAARTLDEGTDHSAADFLLKQFGLRPIETTKRYPENLFWDEFKVGIPGLRGQVSSRSPRR